jgi:TM2 domain-containing membrane protein YozV
MRDKNSAALLAFFLGGIGAHKFYLHRTVLGIVYLVFCWTFIPAIVALIDAIILAAMSKEAFDAKYNTGYDTGLLPAVVVPPQQNIVVNVANTANGTVSDVAGQIKSLHELRTAGALTEEEFTSQKQKLLTGG